MIHCEPVTSIEALTELIDSTKNAEAVLRAIALGATALDRTVSALAATANLHRYSVARVGEVFTAAEVLAENTVRLSQQSNRISNPVTILSYNFTFQASGFYLGHLSFRTAQNEAAAAALRGRFVGTESLRL